MGNDISTVGGAIATAATAVAAGVTLGQVEVLNQAVVDCAGYTAEKAQDSIVRHSGEATAFGIATVGTAIAAGVTFGQVDALNETVVDMAKRHAHAATESTKATLEFVDGVTDGIPVIGHAKGGIMYAIGDNERGGRAMKAASRTTGVMAAGAGGFLVGGPAGAVVAGIAGGAAMDGITTGVESAIHDEFRPNGQIAAWTEVAKGENPNGVIGGVIGGLLTPVCDGLAGYGAGKGLEAKLQNRDIGSLQKYLDGEGNMSMDESFDAMNRIGKRNVPGVEYRPEEKGNEARGKAKYGDKTIPEEALVEGDRNVYRGDKTLLKEGNIEKLFDDGVQPRGGFDDVFVHQRGDGGCNFVSTSKKFGIAKEFGEGSRGRFALMKARATNGVDINLTGELLDNPAFFPGQQEIAIFKGIAPQDIHGVLEVPGRAAAPIWHPNPNFRPPVPELHHLPVRPHGVVIIASEAVVEEILRRS
ncbi:hypothetical protein R1flu_007259 [Riccia fluitans]|uniref:Uncharacterized protein n=1 Tax=Riccia fluitans TaxID=41844 RepID=A0ABD1YYC7_9MARC